jgi:hypothetical protein
MLYVCPKFLLVCFYFSFFSPCQLRWVHIVTRRQAYAWNTSYSSCLRFPFKYYTRCYKGPRLLPFHDLSRPFENGRRRLFQRFSKANDKVARHKYLYWPSTWPRTTTQQLMIPTMKDLDTQLHRTSHCQGMAYIR